MRRNTPSPLTQSTNASLASNLTPPLPKAVHSSTPSRPHTTHSVRQRTSRHRRDSRRHRIIFSNSTLLTPHDPQHPPKPHRSQHPLKPHRSQYASRAYCQLRPSPRRLPPRKTTPPSKHLAKPLFPTHRRPPPSSPSLVDNATNKPLRRHQPRRQPRPLQRPQDNPPPPNLDRNLFVLPNLHSPTR